MFSLYLIYKDFNYTIIAVVLISYIKILILSGA